MTAAAAAAAVASSRVYFAAAVSKASKMEVVGMEVEEVCLILQQWWRCQGAWWAEVLEVLAAPSLQGSRDHPLPCTTPHF